MMRLLMAASLLVATLSAPPAQAEPALPLSFLDSVSCVSTTSCLAVGDRTAVVGTSDGGATWTRRSSPPNVSSLTSVECVAADRCFVTGDDSRDVGVIWLTTDGGASWVLRPATVPGGFFFAVSCPSRTTCVATGNQGAVATTADGGRHWTSSVVDGASQIYDVDCVTALVCAAIGYSGANGVAGVALRSTDGGQHWAVTPFPDTFPEPEAIDCTSVQRCVAVGSDRLNGRKQVTRVFVTIDGGVTWQRKPTPAGYVVARGVSCPSATTCFLANLGPTGILATADGGTTWATQGPSPVFLHDVSCPDTTTCFAVGESERRGSAAVFATTNGGRVWHRQMIAP